MALAPYATAFVLSFNYHSPTVHQMKRHRVSLSTNVFERGGGRGQEKAFS